MNNELITGIINNVILLLGLGIIYSLLPSTEAGDKKRKIVLQSVFVGLSLSLIVVLIMLSSFQLTEGVTLDTRSVFISMTALFFGFVPTLMVVVTASIVRIIQGGVGAFPGVLVIVSSGIIGILFRKFRFNKIKDRKNYRLLEVLLFGVIVHVVMLIMFLALPKDSRIEIIKNIYGYVLTIYPLTTVVFASFMFKRYEWFKNIRVLSETEDNFSRVVETAPVPIMLHAEDGAVLSISKTWSDISGYSHKEIPTINAWTDKAYGEKQEELNVFIQNLYNLKESHHDGEFQIKAKDGKTLLWDFYSTYIGKLPDGRKMAMSVALDITNRAELLAELLSEKQLMETTLLSVGDGVIVADINGNITIINRVAETLTGWSSEEAVGTSIDEVFNIVSDKTGKKCENIVDKVIESGITQELANHTNLVSKDGTIRPIADSAAPITKANKEIVGVIVVFRDYTEKYNEEKKIKGLVEDLQRSEILLEATFDSAKEIIIIALDKEYRYLYFNEAHRLGMLSAYNSEVEIGDCILDYITSEEDKKNIKKNYDITLSGEAHTTLEKYGDIESNYYENKFNPIYDNEGNIFGITVFAENITSRVLMENIIISNEKRYRGLIDNLHSGVVIHAPDTTIIASNLIASNLLGIASDKLIGKFAFDEDFEFVNQMGEKLLVEEYPVNVIKTTNKPISELIIGIRQTQSSDITWVSVNGIPILDDEGKLSEIVISFKDITENKISKEKLIKSEEKLKTTQQIAKISQWEMNLDMNEIIAASEDLKRHDIIKSNGLVEASTIINMIIEEDREMVQNALDELVMNNKPFNIIFGMNSLDNQRIYINSRAVLELNENNKPIKIIGMNQDITELKEKEKELEIAAYNDYLTGLYNRRYYETSLQKIDVEENYPLTIVMADINGLKLINDAFGHTVGDELLVAAGKLIKANCRETDLLARIGGDEFVIVMPKTDDKMAEEIIGVINKKAKLIKTKSIPLSISFGYRCKHHENENIHEVFRGAEDLMYREKLLEIPSMRSGAIETILNTLYEKDAKSEVHSRSVSELSEKIAKVLGMTRQDLAEVKTAGLLHDIGKIIIPSAIINKDGKLTKDEYEEIKNHPEIGFRILNSTQNMREISNIVLNHHERWDGKGYPRGILAEDIPIKSRIISIADAFDAMTSERSYRDSVSQTEALKEIKNNAGTQFDPDLVRVFEEHFTELMK